jgi:hypothetical protein
MKKMKFAMAMLAAGGGAGVAAQAVASTVYTDTLDIPMDQALTPITVVGSAPQFEFGEDSSSYTYFETYAYANGGPANSGVGLKTGTPGLPSAGETYTDGEHWTGKSGEDLGFSSPDSDSYIHLTFTSGSTTYYGAAFVDAAGELETITYAAGVPEPDAWALLIAGAAFTGGALRTGRRRSAALAA